VIYAVLILFSIYYLLPLYVMLVNSVKPLTEIQQGRMLSLPLLFTLEPWGSAWSTAQIGVQPTGLKPYFINSLMMVVPAVAISTFLGALNGYVLTKWRFPGHNIVFGLMLLACFTLGIAVAKLRTDAVSAPIAPAMTRPTVVEAWVIDVDSPGDIGARQPVAQGAHFWRVGHDCRVCRRHRVGAARIQCDCTD
jgi:hypothetical protein